VADIDWRIVGIICREQTNRYVGELNADEKRAVVRRLMPRMLTKEDWYWSKATAAKLTAEDVAELLRTSSRWVQRAMAELRNSNPMTCINQNCMEHIWVDPDTNIIEAHTLPESVDQCPNSGGQMVSGLASIRPDLYQWLETA